MKETKYLPRWRVVVWNVLAGAMIIFTLLLSFGESDALYVIGVILLLLTLILRFVWFRCPHCGRLLNLLPSGAVRDGIETVYCPRCGGPYSCR